MTLRAVIKTLFMVPLLLVAVQAAAAAPDPAEVVKDTSSKVLERLRAEKAQLEENPGRIYELIYELVLPHFDFTSMSRWVLGREVWKTASEEQRRAFIDEFQTLLVRTYAKALLEYSDEEIKYYPAQGKPDSRLVLVKTEVQQPSGSGAIPIHYRMHLSNEQWRVVDVAVDGVSLVSTYRNSYAAQIRKEGLDALIEKIEERNRQLAGSTQAATSAE